MSVINEAKLQNLLDKVEINDLVTRFTRALDIQNWDMFRSCFVDEIELDFEDSTGQPATTKKTEDFVAFGRSSLKGLKTQHHSFNHEITFDKDRAVCISSIFVMHHCPNSYGENLFNMHGYYTMSLVRSPEGWKIQKLKQSLTWCEGHPTLLPVNLSF